jgi:hypothetical protein
MTLNRIATSVLKAVRRHNTTRLSVARDGLQERGLRTTVARAMFWREDFSMLKSSWFRGSLCGHLILGCCTALLVVACGGGAQLSGSGVKTKGTGATGAAGGTSTGMSCSGSCGATVLTMTDAAGDFLSYIVTLTSLQLQTASGASVETLPAAAQVDFTKLVNLTEVLSAGQIPTADYVSAKLTLDFAKAQISADDGNGTAVALMPVDANGNPLTGTLTVSVMLDNANQLIITPGNTGRLAFDFNLAASNMVSLTAKTVQVAPTLVATVVPSNTKPARVRGQLVSVNAAMNDFVVNVQPFGVQTATAGQVTAQVSATTTYQINGTAYVGMAGLTALAALPANTMLAAFGSLQTGAQPVFTATNILAGTSLENPARDKISGTVIARSMNNLTVRSATWTRPDGDFGFEPKDTMVTVGANTSVTKEGQMGTFTDANISVGQHIDAFGMATQGANGAVTLDATAGQVQMDITPLWGTVTAMATGSLTLNLRSLDGLSPKAFTFAGTGTSTAMDATATAYVVNTGTLSQAGLAMNAPARAFGFVTPFGMAPPDFTAQSLENFADVRSDLLVNWGKGGSAMAFTGLMATSTSLQLDLANVGDVHVIKIGPELVDLTKLAMPPSVVPSTANGDVFTIAHNGKLKVENFNTFAAFVTQLTADLAGTATGTLGMTSNMPATVQIVAAAGQYDTAKNVFTVQRLAVLLSN